MLQEETLFSHLEKMSEFVFRNLDIQHFSHLLLIFNVHIVFVVHIHRLSITLIYFNLQYFSLAMKLFTRNYKLILNNIRSNKADLELKLFFHNCEAAFSLHICFRIRRMVHQHLNSHIAYSGSPTEPSNNTRGQFLHLPSYPLFKLLRSKSDNKVSRKTVLDQYHIGTPRSSIALL